MSLSTVECVLPSPLSRHHYFRELSGAAMDTRSKSLDELLLGKFSLHFFRVSLGSGAI